MTQGRNEIRPSTEERMDIDTSFLDAYRVGGSQGLKKTQALAQQLESAKLQKDLASEPETAPDAFEHEQGSAQRGGSGPSGDAAAPAPPQGEVVTVDAAAAPRAHGGAQDVPAAALDGDTNAAPPMPPHTEEDLIPPVPLQHTDHQEAVQSTATRDGSSRDDSSRDDSSRDDGGSSEALPQTGFRLSGVKSQPAVRALPEAVVGALREQLRSAAVRELGASDAAAREFAQRLSQASLVTAFLLAQLDLGLVVDAATRRAAQLFRSRDPLLGSVVARTEVLEHLAHAQGEQLRWLGEELAAVHRTSTVIEQALAYSIADRTENFLRGSHDIREAPITHKNAVFVRDRAREETRKQLKWEKERDGKPIR